MAGTAAGDVLVPLPGREVSGGRTNPLDGVLDTQVPQPDRAVIATCGQRVPIGTEPAACPAKAMILSSIPASRLDRKPSLRSARPDMNDKAELAIAADISVIQANA
jgi:hypothetical protein